MKISELNQLIKASKDSIEFIPTGFTKLDALLDGGFLRKELIILGGFTGSGKSYLASQIMFNAVCSGFRSAYFSLEISGSMIASRLVGQLSGIKPTRLIWGGLTLEEQKRRLEAEAKIEGYDNLMDIFDEDYQLSEIVKKIRAGGYEFVVIDFIQNVIHRGSDEYARLSEVSLEIQKLAKQTNCCIVVLSQLSNSAAKNQDGQVEYKGSGSIAMVADIAFTLTKQADIAPGYSFQPLKLLVKKNRRGYSGNTLELKMLYPSGEIKTNE